MKLPRWRHEQKVRRSNQIKLRLKLALLVLLLVAIGFIGFALLKELSSPKLNKNSRVTIVFASNPIEVLSFEPDGNLTLISIPENAYVEVPRGFGSYQIGNVWELGYQEKIQGELLRLTIQELLGAPVDGWVGQKIISSQPNLKSYQWKAGEFKNDLLAVKNKATSWAVLTKPQIVLSTINNLQTNLNTLDLVWLWWQVKFTRFDKIQFVNLKETSALSKYVLADDSQVLSVSQALLDSVCAKLFKNSQFVNEHLNIEVLNGTNKQGLANRVARLITNMGGNVIYIQNSSTTFNRCQISGSSSSLQSFTARRLQTIYGCQLLANNQISQADLQITVGQDYSQRLLQK